MYDYLIIGDGVGHPPSRQRLAGINSHGIEIILKSASGIKFDQFIRPGRDWETKLEGTTNCGKPFKIIQREGKWYLQVQAPLRHT